MKGREHKSWCPCAPGGMVIRTPAGGDQPTIDYRPPASACTCGANLSDRARRIQNGRAAK